MSDRVNLADPDCEPTDEQLAELMHRAFAGVAEKRRAALAKLRAGIATERQRVLRELDRRAEARRTGR